MKAYSINVHSRIPAVVLSWGTFISSAEYRQALDEVLEVLQKNNYSLLMIDAINARVVSPADRQWTIEDWGKRANYSGLKRTAIIESGNLFNQVSVRAMEGEVKKTTHLLSAIVNTEEQALAYLQAVD